MREWLKVALGVLALTIGASAPTLILETAFFRSIYQTEHPRDWNIKSSDQEPNRPYSQNQASTPASSGTEMTSAHPTKDHTATGAAQSDQNNSNPEPSWVSVAQGMSAIAAIVLTIVIASINFAQWSVYRRQAKIMIRQLGAARISLRAARRSAELAELSLTSLQRAFVTSKGISARRIENEASIVTWILTHEWENSGTTPTRFGTAHISWSDETWKQPMQDNWDFPDFGANGKNPVLIGPKVVVNTPPTALSVDELIAIQDGKRFFYIWGWVSYRDIFPNTKIHITRFAYHLSTVMGNLKVEPSLTNPIGLGFTPLPRHNCADEECEDQTYAGGP